MHVRTDAHNARKGFCCSLLSAILALSIPLIATPRQTRGETLCGAAADTWVSACVPHPALGGSTSRCHDEEKGGTYDGGRHIEYYEARDVLSGPLRFEQSVRQGTPATGVPRRGTPGSLTAPRRDGVDDDDASMRGRA